MRFVCPSWLRQLTIDRRSREEKESDRVEGKNRRGFSNAMSEFAARLRFWHVLLIPFCHIIVYAASLIGARLWIFAISLSLIIYFLREEIFYPSGPRQFPIFKNLLTIDAREPHRSVIGWKRAYGPIFDIGLPMKTTVLASPETIRAVGSNRHSTGRPTSYLYQIFIRDKKEGNGLILASGETWKRSRNFANTFLRSFGVSSDGINDAIVAHADNMVKLLEREMEANGGVVNPQRPISFTVANVIYRIVFGRSCDYNDEKIWKLKQLLDDVLATVQSPQMLLADTVPRIAPMIPADRVYKQKGFALQEFFRNELETQRKLYEGSETDEQISMHNLFTAYFNDPEALVNGDMDCILLAGDLWTGGMETTLTALLWGIMHLMKKPDLQDELYTEIQRVFGDCPTSQIRYSERKKSPLIEATLNEIMRIANVLPWNIPHRAQEDIVVDGHVIEKDSNIMFSYSSVHHDPQFFPKPDEFVPERFLRRTPTEAERETIESEGGKVGDFVVFEKNPNFYPFGFGPRRCPGEGLAVRELYIFMISLLRTFKFSNLPDRPPSFDRKIGMTSSPYPFECRIQRRSDLEKESFIAA